MINKKGSIKAEPTAGMLVREAREAHGMTRTELARAIIESGRYAGRFTNPVNLNDQLMWAEKDSRGLTTLALDIIAKAKAEWAAALQKAAKNPTAKTTPPKPKATKKQPAKKTKVSKKSPAQEIALAVADRIEVENRETVSVA